MSSTVEIALDFMPFGSSEAYAMLQANHAKVLNGSIHCRLYGRDIFLPDVPGFLRKNDSPHFNLECPFGSFGFGHVRNSGLSLIFIERCVVDFVDAALWIAPFSRLPAFRQARVYDADYDLWQNAEDPIEYESVGRPHGHLPRRSNGLRPPLNRMIIDTSNNPGRRQLRAGYVEAVGAMMWLAPQFWNLTGASRETILECSCLKCSEMPNGVLQIQAAEQPFTSDTGESRELQEQMRSLLFPRDVNGSVG